jgi:thioredoxin reductase
MAQNLVDVLILGGGPGGLATATGLARQLYTAVVFDNKVYRNARADHMHNVPGWDHQPPSALRDKARSDLLSRYSTVQFQDIAISQVRKNGTTGHYEAVDQTGLVWTGRKLVLANGAAEVHPDIEGYAECWGYSMYDLVSHN